MWVIAGVLLGLVVLASLIGFHVGPHAHVAAGIFGVLAAAWLVVMAVDGRSAPVLWALLSADLVVSAGIGTMAWKGLTTRGINVAGRHLVSPNGAEGVAIGDLDPEGIVRVHGENWSAVAVNGPVRRGRQCRWYASRESASKSGVTRRRLPAEETSSTSPSRPMAYRPRLPRRTTKEVAHDHRDRDRSGGALPPHPRRDLGEDRA